MPPETVPSKEAGLCTYIAWYLRRSVEDSAMLSNSIAHFQLMASDAIPHTVGSCALLVKQGSLASQASNLRRWPLHFVQSPGVER